VHSHSPRDLATDLVLPTILFAALGGMTWAVRGCSGFGASAGCVFAGVAWGAAWWFIAQRAGDGGGRPYRSGWIILALALGIGFSGNRGWMQWPSFFLEHLQTNTPAGQFEPIPRAYGFLWLFIAGVPWAGLGVCLLAWCRDDARPLRWTGWVIRLGCGLGAAYLAGFLFDQLPDLFLPLHTKLASLYADLPANPNLRRLINDNRAAVIHLGLYLGFLGFEVGRRDWRNAGLILTVGLLNGLGWSMLQNWTWATQIWPRADFNFWRCWESSGGISIGIAYGVAFFLFNRPQPVKTPAEGSLPATQDCATLDRVGVHLGLWLGLGWSVRNGLKGWANIYLGREEHWDQLLWNVFAPVLLIGTVAIGLVGWRRRKQAPKVGSPSRAYRVIWIVLIVQNAIAQLVTGPWSQWNEVAFALYYLLLFIITALVVHHFHRLAHGNRPQPLIEPR